MSFGPSIVAGANPPWQICGSAMTCCCSKCLRSCRTAIRRSPQPSQPHGKPSGASLRIATGFKEFSTRSIPMRHPMSVVLTAVALVSVAAPLDAVEASFGKDLKATIALQGMPCDQILEAKRQADSNYLAPCKEGNRYHVFVNPQGRVVGQKLTP